MAKLSGRLLVQELKDGSRSGCRNLNAMYRSRLVREATGAYRIPREDAEELVNDVLLSVMDRIAGFEFKGREDDFHRWVMTIFRNRVRDYIRRRALTDGLQRNFDEARFEDESLSTDIEREVLASITRTYQESVQGKDGDSSQEGAVKAVAAVLEKMEPWEQMLLRCRSLQVPYEEIAAYTGKNAKQLKVYYGRVIGKLHKLLVREYPGIGQKGNRQ